MPYTEDKKSARSKEAIENFRVPYILIDNEMIDAFLKKCLEDSIINEKDYQYLQRFKPGVWQYVAKECTDCKEWHHYGKYYPRLIHYNLSEALAYILEHKETIVKDYITYKTKIPKEKTDYRNYVICKFAYNVWDNRKKHRRIVNVQHRFGVSDGKIVYYMDHGKVCRKKWAGNNVYNHGERKYEELDEKTQKEINTVYQYLENNEVFPED